ncbi:flagellar biosynthesis protein FliQ [Kordiimonas sp. SCSIO 12603]|uniref:flagellar biosynthesis protein FliQ n=1 Tax=Kordiimonas sp. SCSIO 12603 TaxID=2829596 RepID=UPI0021076797|nr:flagellar biosynthesis protein FliQ [Kordiimonas sp. SCSIO 12603]UTW57261.1 flagellar biosynthesis protein FliQ [Kordiimonas sp. SCSIO 12603]
MTDLEVMDVARDALTTLLYVVSPILGVGLVVGLAIAFFQALTQLQEMTLTFVPKIIAVFGAILILMPYMGRLMGDFMMRISERIVGG